MFKENFCLKKLFIILKPKRSLTLVDFWKLKCDCFVMEAFLVHNIDITIWEVLLKFFILLSMVKKNNIYMFMGRMLKCKTFKAFLTIRLVMPLQDFFSHLTSQFSSFMTLLSKTNLPMYNYFYVRCKQMWWRTIPIQIG
jgi:hypothetical protein